jgi:hypothetical protein
VEIPVSKPVSAEPPSADPPSGGPDDTDPDEPADTDPDEPADADPDEPADADPDEPADTDPDGGPHLVDRPGGRDDAADRAADTSRDRRSTGPAGGHVLATRTAIVLTVIAGVFGVLAAATQPLLQRWTGSAASGGTTSAPGTPPGSGPAGPAPTSPAGTTPTGTAPAGAATGPAAPPPGQPTAAPQRPTAAPAAVPPRADIISPTDGADVPRCLDARGSASLPPGTALWLVVRVSNGDHLVNNRVPVTADGRWSLPRVTVGGDTAAPNPTYQLLLMSTRGELTAAFANHLYPGDQKLSADELAAAPVLDRISVRRTTTAPC